jgi:hypothetical protein
MVIPAQGLGWLDCQLIAEDARLAEAPPFEHARPMALNEQITLSYLWVLGGYELVRTIDQRHAADERLQSMSPKLSQLKRTFARVRVPLAKFEPASRHRDTDTPFAWPARHPTLGSAWRVADNEFISRRELSNEMLDLLESMPGKDHVAV